MMSAQNGQREIMNSRTKLFGALAAVLGVVLLYGGWLAVRAQRNLVTLNVRNMDVRQVVKKIQWQTWEIVQLHKDVQGKVTLRVHDMPLEQVLRMVGEQTLANSSVIYPLYSSGKSLAALKKALRGEIDPAVNGWTNLQNRAAFRGGPGGMMPSVFPSFTVRYSGASCVLTRLPREIVSRKQAVTNPFMLAGA